LDDLQWRIPRTVLSNLCAIRVFQMKTCRYSILKGLVWDYALPEQVTTEAGKPRGMGPWNGANKYFLVGSDCACLPASFFFWKASGVPRACLVLWIRKGELLKADYSSAEAAVNHCWWERKCCFWTVKLLFL